MNVDVESSASRRPSGLPGAPRMRREDDPPSRSVPPFRSLGRGVWIALGVLVVVGLAIRGTAIAAWWPAATTLGDSWPYAYYATADLFADPQHPAGYSIFLAIGGLLTHSLGAFVVFQHLLGIVAALVLFVAVWRLCGSPWPGVAGAGVVLLGADQVYLEHSIMSEILFLLLLAVTMYVVARTLEAPERLWPWPVVLGALVVAVGMTRTAGLFLIPVIAIGLAMARPGPWTPRLMPVASFLCTAGVLLFSYAVVNAISHERFEITPTSGWHLYGRVAPFADCEQFDPPAGTEGLCERTPPAERLGTDHYLYDKGTPSKRVFGPEPFEQDAKLGAFGRAAAINQPGAYLEAVWKDVRAYFFPDTFVYRAGGGSDLDGQLDWTGPTYPETERATETGMKTFFDDFSVSRDSGTLGVLHDYQRIFRFGGTALTIAALLILAGLFVGSRRSRVAVLVLGVGGLAMLVLPTFSVIYIARYTVPLAGLIAAGAIVAAMALAQAARARISLEGLRGGRLRGSP